MYKQELEVLIKENENIIKEKQDNKTTSPKKVRYINDLYRKIIKPLSLHNRPEPDGNSEIEKEINRYMRRINIISTIGWKYWYC